MKQFEKVNIYPIELKGRFNSFITTEFDDSMTIDMKMRVLIKWIKENVDLTNEMVDYLNNFIIEFDVKLFSTLEAVLNKWLADGILKDLMDEILLDEINKLTNYLNVDMEIIKRDTTDMILYSFFRGSDDPDNFSGVDLYVSSDGLSVKRLNTKPITTAQDPCITTINEKFYILSTSFNPHDFRIQVSKDLKTWETHDISLGIYDGNRIWAPEFFFDESRIYITYSKQVGETSDIDGKTIPDFRQWIVEMTDPEKFEFGTPYQLELENKNKIDGSIAKFNCIYYLLIKDEYDKKIELWVSEDMKIWEKQRDEITELGTQVEGCNVVKFNNKFYIYVDAYYERVTYVSTTVDFNLFTERKAINTKYAMKHGGGTLLDEDWGIKQILSNFDISNQIIPENTVRKRASLNDLSVNGVLTNFKPLNNYLYTVGNGETITINSIKNINKVDDIYIVLLSASNAKLILNNGSGLQVPQNNYTFSAEYQENDMFIQLKWDNVTGKYRVTKNSLFNFLTSGNFLAKSNGYKTINLSSLASSGVIDVLNYEDGVCYQIIGAEQITINNVTNNNPVGSRFFLLINSIEPTASITIKNTNYMKNPKATDRILTGENNSNILYEISKFSGINHHFKN